jgi:O-antigen ligase
MKKLNSQEKIIVLATLLIIMVFNPNSFDPYNSIKFFLLVFFGIVLCINLFLRNDFTKIYRSNKTVTVLSGIFLVTLTISTLVTSDNITQSLLGAYGRNNGLLSWISLIIFFLISSYSRNQMFLHIFMRYFVIIGLVLGLYAWSQYTKNDFVRSLYPWFNQSGRIDASFGNTNLFSVFSAFVMIFSFGFSLSKNVNKNFKILTALTLGIYLPFVPRIDFQGRVLSIFGLAILLTIWLIFNKVKLLKNFGYLFLTGTVLGFVFLLLSFFRLGPLSSFILDYFPSLRDRIFFWEAAVRIIRDFPLFGVGIDEMSYWYREYRVVSSINYRGPVGEGADNVHNIFLQLAATTGLFTLISFILVLVFVGICCIKVIKNCQKDFSIISLVVVWAIFIIQALISFDNLAILVIGFVVSGLLVSLSRTSYYSDNGNVDLGHTKTSSFKVSPLKFIVIIITLAQLTIITSYQVNDLYMHSKWREIKSTIESNQQLEQIKIDEFTSEVLKSQQSGKRMRAAEQVLLYGQASPALKIADMTAKEFPKEIQAWNTMARIFEAFGKFDLATKAWEKAVQLDPLNSELKTKFDESISKSPTGVR